MSFSRVVVTGGAGFVGSALAAAFKRGGVADEVIALDNLARAGSALNLPWLEGAGVTFLRADVRDRAAMLALAPFELLVDCAAEPSVHAGYAGGPLELIDINLMGTAHALEAARRQGAAFLFLSTSRIYPVGPLRALPLVETGGRLSLPVGAAGPGYSALGIAETFPLAGARTYYGATKLAAELLVQEYVFGAGLRALINRCGVIAGPRQMARADQGVLALWVAAHLAGSPLSYRGFGGRGVQVRDALHIADLVDLVLRQVAQVDAWDGGSYNVGGGVANAVSLVELTALCAEAVGPSPVIGSRPETDVCDIPWYVTDARVVEGRFGWRPARGVADIVGDIACWLRATPAALDVICGRP